MKIFIYKSLLVFFLVLILFKLTIGSLINNYEKKINLTLSKDNLVNIKNKLREEIKSGIKKERILNQEDALIIQQFIDKLAQELRESK